MVEKNKNDRQNDDHTSQQDLESCPRNYKPWVWTLILMALLTIGWTVYESYQDGGLIQTLMGADDYGAVTGDMLAGVIPSGGTNAAGLKVQAASMQETYHGIIERVRPAVISIDADMGGGRANAGQGPAGVNYTRAGSGVIIDPKGFVLSSLHVVAGATALKASVYGPGGAKDYPLKVVNVDQNTDLVLLRIIGQGSYAYAVLGDSDVSRTGDVVLAMGSPFGFDNTITAGIISSRNRTLNIGGKIFEGVIQTDTPINRGNSGGPLVNVRGEVIGINTAIYSPTEAFSGIGFSIPVNQAATLVAGVVDFRGSIAQVAAGQIANWGRRGRQVGNTFKLPNGQVVNPPHTFRGKCIECHPQLQNPVGLTPGQVQPGLMQPVAGQAATTADPFIGATTLDVDPVIAEQFHLLHRGGVLIDKIYPGTPADNAGLKRGDIILRVDGRRVRDVVGFEEMLDARKVGSKFEFVLLSGGARRKVDLRTVGTPPFLPRPMTTQVKEFEWLGSEIRPLTASLAPFVRTGVYVADAGGVLRAAGMMRGDVIKAVNKESVMDMTSFIRMTQTLNVREGFLLDIIRNGEPMYLTIRG